MKRKIIDSLLLNAYTIESAGLMHGKAGIALTLFEVGRYCKDETIENHAFNLLCEVLAYNGSGNDFATGRAGIAYVVHYLIKNRFLDADYMELYGDSHTEIVNGIMSCEYKEQESARYTGDLLFISTLADYLHKEEYDKCLNTVTDNICRTLENFCSHTSLNIAPYFHEYAASLLAVCNFAPVKAVYADKFVGLIKEIQDKLDEKDAICEYPSYPVQVHIYGMLRDKKDIQEDNDKILGMCMRNIVIPAFDFRKKTNLIFSLYKLYALNHALDYREMANSLFDTLTDEDSIAFEEKIYNNIFRMPAFSIGIREGISRLALLFIYRDQLGQENFPEHISWLFH
ncbi:MAG: hypothetical protein LBU44_04210 [Mediterranea sp.]|jgi:hypothetical protein|nr:hypothetical protein [Mediterranea sp.]